MKLYSLKLIFFRNFHIYKEIDTPRLNDFMQFLNLNFHMALENIDNRALNTLWNMTTTIQ